MRTVDDRGGEALAAAVRKLYAAGQTDYSLDPIVLIDRKGTPIGRVSDGDALVFCCRRGEREIQLTEAFTEPSFNRFLRPALSKLTFIPLTLYHEKFKDLPVAFAPSRLRGTLGEQIGRAGLRQLHVAESEKYAHITFFFNGGQNQPFPGEIDERVPSPKGVAFESVPELSLAEVAGVVRRGISQRYDFIAVNFANGDVIGHTSSRDSKVKCAALVDAHLKAVVETATQAGYVVFITADHGNLELMMNSDGSPHVAHTTNPVPFIAIDPRSRSPERPRDGRLADVAPTLLAAMGIPPAGEFLEPGLLPDHVWEGPHRVLLIILDGWGNGARDATNPIFVAPTPFWDRLITESPCSQLGAAGEDVGLRPGKAGNSEAGHMNLGAGCVVLQDDTRLERAMQDGSFQSNAILCGAVEGAKERGANLHLIGLLSEKSSHGSIEYPLAILRMARARGLRDVYIHLIFDGRSTAPGSAPELLQKLDAQVREIGVGRIVTGVGRGIALDRDGNYDKTRRAYEALVLGKGEQARGS